MKVAVSQEKEDGFSAYSESNSNYDPSKDSDNDGFESNNLSLELAYKFSESFNSRVNIDYSEGSVDYDPAASSKDSKNYNVALSNEYKTDKWVTSLVVATNQDHNNEHSYSSWTGVYTDATFETQRNSVYLNSFYQLTNELNVGGGIDWYKDDVSNSTDAAKFDETSRTNLAGFVTGVYQKDDLQLEASLRNDDNQRYGNNTTWQFGVGYQVIEHYKLTFNSGTAFRAPTFNDLYSTNPIYGDSGNPNLKPEQSENMEVALIVDYFFSDYSFSGI